MAGVGPSMAHGTGPDGGTFWGLSSVADFMLWPAKNVGWYVEPGYEVAFRDRSTHHGFGITAGLLIGPVTATERTPTRRGVNPTN